MAEYKGFVNRAGMEVEGDFYERDAVVGRINQNTCGLFESEAGAVVAVHGDSGPREPWNEWLVLHGDLASAVVACKPAHTSIGCNRALRPQERIRNSPEAVRLRQAGLIAGKHYAKTV